VYITLPRNHVFSRLAIIAAISVACGSSRDASTNSDTVATGNEPPATAASAPADSASVRKAGPQCEPTGLWAECSVKKRLESAGFVPLPAPPTAKRAGFSVAPIAYTLGHARLELFLYPDARALARDLAHLDTTAAAPVGATNSWEAPPTFIRSANLAAVFLTDNARQAERVTLALTAGAPQPRGPQKLKPSISTPSSPR
jgi:hypothetical protein